METTDQLVSRLQIRLDKIILLLEWDGNKNSWLQTMKDVRKGVEHPYLYGIDILLRSYSGVNSFSNLMIGQKEQNGNFVGWKRGYKEKNETLNLLREDVYDIANQIKSNLGEDKKNSSLQKSKSETKIATISLILTASLAIITTIITIVLHFRNEQFQKQLIDLQAKAELANISMVYHNNVVNINNLGPAPAQDLRLVICITSLDSKWVNSIKSISDLDLAIDNSAIENSTQIKLEGCNSQAVNNDALQITIKSLPPQQSFKILVKPSSNISLDNLTTEAEVFVSVSDASLVYGASYATPTRKPSSSSSSQTPQSPDQLTVRMWTSSPLDNALENYLMSSDFRIANFEISIACTNCNIDKKQFILSSFTHKEINEIISIYDPTNKIFRIDSTFNYYLPTGAKYNSPKELYLIAKMDTNSQIILVKSNKFEFVTPTPISTKMPPTNVPPTSKPPTPIPPTSCPTNANGNTSPGKCK